MSIPQKDALSPDDGLLSILDLSNDGLHIVDMRGNLVYCNAAFLKMLGYDQQDSKNLHVTDWDQSIPEDKIQSIIAEIFHTPTTFETRHRRKDGSTLEVEINAKGIILNGQNYISASSRDISERKRTEQLQEEAIQRAKAASKAKSAFLATMSHEIRTPMTGIIGYANLLMDDDIPDHSLEKVRQIKQSTRFLLRIINDVLDISKLEAGKLDVEKISFDLPQTLKDVFDTFAKQWHTDSAVNWTLQLDEGLPRYVRTDPTRLRQILMNLLGNAQKFTHKGSIELTCRATTDDDGTPLLECQVKDSGIGMTPDVSAAIFSEFTQADPSIARKYEGTGLGLAICKKLTDLMGGQIGVNSTPHKGSTFWLKIPFEIGKKPTERCRKSVSASRFSAIRPLRILLAEDNVINQRLITKFLDKYGHHITLANNGQQALDLHQQEAFDLILMDIRMPEMDGIQATKAIRALLGDKADIPIIAVTADAVQDQIYQFMAAGMDAYVYKPINWTQLILSINQVMKSNIHILNEDAYG